LAKYESVYEPEPVVGESDKAVAKRPRKSAAKNRKKAARLSEKSRWAIQESAESHAALARRFGRDYKTILKWRGRLDPKSLRMGPKTPMPRLLTAKEEVVIAAFRRRTRLPLEDCLVLLRPIIPNLNRSQLYRCLRRYGLGRIGETAPAPPIFGFVPQGPRNFLITLDRIPVAGHAREDENEFDHLFLFVLMALDSVTNKIFARCYAVISPHDAAKFLVGLVAATPQKIFSVTTPKTPMFTEWDGDKMSDLNLGGLHPFWTACRANDIYHLVNHPDLAILPEIKMKE
jgi:transposase